MKRTYTLPEANQVLRLVRAIAAELVERRSARRHLARQREQLEAADTPKDCVANWPSSTRRSGPTTRPCTSAARSSSSSA